MAWSRSLRPLRGQISSWRPFGPLDFLLLNLLTFALQPRALRPCSPRRSTKWRQKGGPTVFKNGGWIWCQYFVLGSQQWLLLTLCLSLSTLSTWVFFFAWLLSWFGLGLPSSIFLIYAGLKWVDTGQFAHLAFAKGINFYICFHSLVLSINLNFPLFDASSVLQQTLWTASTVPQ